MYYAALDLYAILSYLTILKRQENILQFRLLRFLKLGTVVTYKLAFKVNILMRMDS